ncbi:hypothetical protein ACFV0O_16360 [Kitasatospora sp. NPDC059577]|uniref:hypothetical protein n=1 Tax=unclassified Kitasatospora TaxID=2633591 RepID=UPI0036B20736
MPPTSSSRSTLRSATPSQQRWTTFITALRRWSSRLSESSGSAPASCSSAAATTARTRSCAAFQGWVAAPPKKVTSAIAASTSNSIAVAEAEASAISEPGSRPKTVSAAVYSGPGDSTGSKVIRPCFTTQPAYQ